MDSGLGDWDPLIGVVLCIFAWRKFEAKGGKGPLYDVVIPIFGQREDVSPDDPSDRVGYPVEPSLFFGGLLLYGILIAAGEGFVSGAVAKILAGIEAGVYGFLLYLHFREGDEETDYYPWFAALFVASLLGFALSLAASSSQIGAGSVTAFFALAAGAYVWGGSYREERDAS